MEKEVREIFEILGTPEGFRGLINSLYSNRVEKACLVLTGIAVICFVVAYPLLPHSYSVWPLIVALTSVLFYTLSAFLGQLRYMLTPVKAYISELARKIGEERKIVTVISHYSRESINAAKNRIEFDNAQLNTRVGFLIGVMDKLGIVPSLIILYLSYAKAMNDPTLEKVPVYILAFLAGLYLGAFFAKVVSSKLSLMVVLLQQAYELSEEREALKLLK